MKQRYIFHHDHYYHTLKRQIGEGVPVFHGVRQRGGGLGSVLGSIAKYAIPLIQRYIIPHAKTAAFSTFTDLASGSHSIKQALKKNSLGFLKNVGQDIAKTANSSGQTGSGLSRKRKRGKSQTTGKKRKTTKKPRKIPKTKKRKSKAKKQARSRLDIFS
jgi:hypothetical protein